MALISIAPMIEIKIPVILLYTNVDIVPNPIVFVFLINRISILPSIFIIKIHKPINKIIHPDIFIKSFATQF